MNGWSVPVDGPPMNQQRRGACGAAERLRGASNQHGPARRPSWSADDIHADDQAEHNQGGGNHYEVCVAYSFIAGLPFSC